MASSKQKIKLLAAPERELQTEKDADTAIKRVNQLVRILHRLGATRQRRNDRNDTDYKIKSEPYIEELDALLDQVLWYVFVNWESLTVGKATESLQIANTAFRRHVDTIGTLILTEQSVIPYLQKLTDASPLAVELRKKLGREKTKTIISQLRRLVTEERVYVLDKEGLKALLKDVPDLSVDGAEVQTNNTVTITPPTTRLSPKLTQQSAFKDSFSRRFE